MSLLYTASFKDFGSLVCLRHDDPFDDHFEKRNLGVTAVFRYLRKTWGGADNRSPRPCAG